MKTSILWNGFEIKKGEISTSVGLVPYLSYSPGLSNEIVNIAIHGEGHEKEDWLCFNSSLSLGNLLKESIKHNSAFIAFDLYGHGDWLIKDKHFNTANLSTEDKTDLIDKSTIGIREAIPTILKDEDFTENHLSITGFSLGCSVVLGLNLNSKICKSILISPHIAPVDSNSTDYYIIHSTNNSEILEEDFNYFINQLPQNTILQKYDTDNEISQSWISDVKKFIY